MLLSHLKAPLISIKTPLLSSLHKEAGSNIHWLANWDYVPRGLKKYQLISEGMKWYSCCLDLRNFVNKLDNNRLLRYVVLDFATKLQFKLHCCYAILFIAMHFSDARGQRSKLEFIVKKTPRQKSHVGLRKYKLIFKIGWCYGGKKQWSR